MTDLHEAVISGNVTLVREILQRDPSRANDRNEYFETPLHEVFYMNIGNHSVDVRLAIAQTLLDYGADVNPLGAHDSNTPLHVATKYNQIRGVKLLLERGADPNAPDGYNYTPLHKAASKGYNEIIRLLLEHGGETTVIDCEGRTPLDEAFLFQSSISGAQILIEAGAKAMCIFKELVQAKGDCLDFIIERSILFGAKIDAGSLFSIKAMYFAWVNENPGVIEPFEKALLKFGIDVDGLKREDMGMTQLHVAVKDKDEHRVQELLEAGADVNAKNVIGETPLHSLINKWTVDVDDQDKLYRIARLLVEAGTDLQARDCFGKTPFQSAVFRQYSRVAILMLAAIAGVVEGSISLARLNLLYRDYGRKCPLEAAIVCGHTEAVDNLINLGHHVIDTMIGGDCEPLLFHAIKQRQYRILKMLLEADCRIYKRCLYGLPVINCQKYNEVDMRMVCLLFESNENVIIKYTLCECIADDLDPNPMIELLVFHFAIGLLMKKVSEEFRSIEQYVKLRRKFSLILYYCNGKLNELKNVKMENGVSYYEILTKPLDSLVSFIEDGSNFDSCEKVILSLKSKDNLESYERILKFCLELAIERKNLLHSAKRRLNEAIGNLLEPNYNSLPDEIVWRIFENLNFRELRKIAQQPV